MYNWNINDIKYALHGFPGTLLTNFPAEEEDIYRKAIAQSGFKMEIKDSAYDCAGNLLKGHKALHYNREKDTSPFWKIFYELEKAKSEKD